MYLKKKWNRATKKFIFSTWKFFVTWISKNALYIISCISVAMKQQPDLLFSPFIHIHSFAKFEFDGVIHGYKFPEPSGVTSYLAKHPEN